MTRYAVRRAGEGPETEVQIRVLVPKRRQARDQAEVARTWGEPSNGGAVRPQCSESEDQVTEKHGGPWRKRRRSFYRKVRKTTRRLQGDRPVGEIIGTLNPLLRGRGTYHRQGQNVGRFTQLDTWVRQRLRAYMRKCWRSRGRHPTNPEFEQMGLFSLRGLLRPPSSQLVLL